MGITHADELLIQQPSSSSNDIQKWLNNGDVSDVEVDLSGSLADIEEYIKSHPYQAYQPKQQPQITFNNENDSDNNSITSESDSDSHNSDNNSDINSINPFNHQDASHEMLTMPSIDAQIDTTTPVQVQVQEEVSAVIEPNLIPLNLFDSLPSSPFPGFGVDDVMDLGLDVIHELTSLVNSTQPYIDDLNTVTTTTTATATATVYDIDDGTGLAPAQNPLAMDPTADNLFHNDVTLTTAHSTINTINTINTTEQQYYVSSSTQVQTPAPSHEYTHVPLNGHIAGAGYHGYQLQQQQALSNISMFGAPTVPQVPLHVAHTGGKMIPSYLVSSSSSSSSYRGVVSYPSHSHSYSSSSSLCSPSSDCYSDVDSTVSSPRSFRDYDCDINMNMNMSSPHNVATITTATAPASTPVPLPVSLPVSLPSPAKSKVKTKANAKPKAKAKATAPAKAKAKSKATAKSQSQSQSLVAPQHHETVSVLSSPVALKRQRDADADADVDVDSDVDVDESASCKRKRHKIENTGAPVKRALVVESALPAPKILHRAVYSDDAAGDVSVRVTVTRPSPGVVVVVAHAGDLCKPVLKTLSNLSREVGQYRTPTEKIKAQVPCDTRTAGQTSNCLTIDGILRFANCTKMSKPHLKRYRYWIINTLITQINKLQQPQTNTTTTTTTQLLQQQSASCDDMDDITTSLLHC